MSRRAGAGAGAYDPVGAEAEALRDIAAHLDQYAVGQGHRQTGRMGHRSRRST
jgi:hypothetical protein